MPTLAGAQLHAHSLIKARILSICFQYFTIWHLCTSRTHLNVAIISVFLYINAYTCGRATSRALSHKSTYTLNLFSVFHYLALMYKSDPPQCCYYISIFTNIWYLIKLIHSIIIILRVFMVYKQRVLANFWGRQDSANCASRKRRGAC